MISNSLDSSINVFHIHFHFQENISASTVILRTFGAFKGAQTGERGCSGPHEELLKAEQLLFASNVLFLTNKMLTVTREKNTVTPAVLRTSGVTPAGFRRRRSRCMHTQVSLQLIRGQVGSRHN